MDAGTVATVAGLLVAAHYLHTLVRVKFKRERPEDLEKIGFSLGALILLGFVLALDVYELAARLGGNPAWTDPGLTVAIGVKLASAAEDALQRLLDAMRAVALASAAATVAFWIASALTGGLALLAAWALNIGLDALLALLRAVVMVAQAVWATGQFYTVIGELAPLFRAFAPLGVALMAAPRTRRAGAGIFALAVLMGYAAPYALNAATAAATLPQEPQPLEGNVTVPAVVNVLQVVTLPDGTNITVALPPGAVLEVRVGNEAYVRPAGVITPLPPNFTLTRLYVTNALLIYEHDEAGLLPLDVRLPPAPARLLCTSGKLEDCEWVDVTTVNITLPQSYFVAGDSNGWGFLVAKLGRFAVNLTLGRARYAEWYGHSYPDLSSRVIVYMKEGWGHVEKFNCTIAGANTTCTRVTVVLAGSISSVEVAKRGLGRVVLNGTVRLLPANVTEHYAPPGYKLGDARWRLALEFNRTAVAFNASMPPGVVNITYVDMNGTKVASNVTVWDYATVIAPSWGSVKKERVLKGVFHSPIHWPNTDFFSRVTVVATYPGEIAEPAVIAISLAPYGAPADSRLLLLAYDPSFEVRKHEVELNELARSWLNLYPFLTLAAAYFAAAVFACDALSGLLGGPSITMRFVPSRWRGAYWGVAVGAIVSGIVSLMSGRGLAAPGGAFLGKYESILYFRRRELALLRQRFPLVKLERAVKERASRLASRLGEWAATEQRILASKLLGAVERAADAGLRRKVVYWALFRIVRSQTPYMIAATAARFAWHLFEHRQSRLATALLAAAADTLRSEAYRRHGALAPIYAPRLLKAAAALDAARILLTPELLAWRLTARVALGAVYRDVVFRGAQLAAAMAALKAAQVAALAAKDQQLLQRLKSAEEALARRAMKPGEALQIAKEAWLAHKGEVEAWLAQVRASAERLIEKAGKIENREELIATLKEVKELEDALKGALPHAPQELRPRIEEAVRALKVADRALFAALGAIEALGEAEGKVQVITIMPQQREKKPAAPVAGWEKWLAEVGLPLEQAHSTGTKLNEMKGGLLESALELLRLVGREKAIAAIRAALRDVGDPALRGLLDALEGRPPDARAVMWGSAEYIRGYASITPERIIELLARGRGKDALEAARLAVKELLGEKVHVPPHLEQQFVQMQVRLRWGDELTVVLERLGLPPARWVSTLQPDVVIAYALSEAAKTGKAEELLRTLGKRYLTPVVEGAVDAVRGAKPEDLLERLEKRDGYALGYAIASPERFAAAVAQALAERLGFKVQTAAQLGALAAAREILHFESVGRVTERVDAARSFTAKLLLEAMYGVDEKLARLIWQLDAARSALQDAAARGDVDMAEALARGFEATLQLRELRGELRQQLPPDRYEALKAEVRAWREAFASSLLAAESFAKFMESLSELVPPEKPAPAAARDLAEGRPTLEELLASVQRGEVEAARRIDLWDAMRLSPEEAARVYRHVEDPFARGVLKAKIGLEPSTPEERLGYLYVRVGELDIPVTARQAVREVIEGCVGEGLPTGEEVKRALSEAYEGARGGDERSLAQYLVMSAVLGIEPGEALASLREGAAEAASREAEAAVAARREAARLESDAAMLKAADGLCGEAVERVPSLRLALSEGASTALKALRESEERAAREALLEARQLLDKAASMYRDLLSRSPELKEVVMERIAKVSEMLAAIEQALEELEGGG
ncbi:MAG: hypothetical protein QXT28_10475 [Thermofilaceae archaeon]